MNRTRERQECNPVCLGGPRRPVPASRHLPRGRADALAARERRHVMELFAWLDLHRLWVASALLAGTGLFVLLLGTWVIPENAAGLVVKRYGKALASGRLVALDG